MQEVSANAEPLPNTEEAKEFTEKKRLEHQILSKVSKLFKEYYQEHGDEKSHRQMNSVREREQRRLKLQTKLIKLRHEKREGERKFISGGMNK